MLAGQWSEAQERLELRALARQYEGVLQEVRLNALGSYLHTHRALAIRHNTCGFAGDRWRIELDDGRVLRLRLYWPHQVAAAALCSVAWVDDQGWRVVVRTTAGEPLVLRAFHASLSC